MTAITPPEYLIELPAQFHGGMTLQAKTELAVVLKVLAEKVIARPDVQIWWHDRPVSAGGAPDVLLYEQMDRAVSRIEETCARLNLAFHPLVFVIVGRYAKEAATEDAVAIFSRVARILGVSDDVIERKRHAIEAAPLSVSSHDIDEDGQKRRLDAAVATFTKKAEALRNLSASAYAACLSRLMEQLKTEVAGVCAASSGAPRKSSELTGC